MLNKKWPVVALIMALGLLVLAACTAEPEVVTVVETRVSEVVVTVEGSTTEIVVTEIVEVTAVPTEAPVKSKDLIICMAQEPETLYRNGGSMLAMTAVLHSVYENVITTRSYDYQAQGITKIPALSDGDAVINVIEVNAGDIVLDNTDSPVELAAGVVVKNSDGEEVTFDGTPVMMEQMVVQFTLQPTVWSDGTPSTADDSVYAFELSADVDTPTSKFAVDRTASYVALDDLTIEWTGVPGFRDATYFTNIWSPMPRHQLGGFTAAELLEAQESSRMPMGNGPFMITEWVAGDHISMVKNPNYYRSSEGLPHLDSVTYKFIPDTNALIAQLLAGSCDIGTQDGMDVGQSPFLIQAEDSGLLVPYFQTGTVFEHIDFNVAPLAGATSWFDDVRVRQAMTMCTDRQSMVDNILYGRSEVIHTYIPSVHPLYPDGLTEWPFDVDAANKLLDEAGFVDTDGDGIRNHPTTAENFSVSLGTTSGNEMRQQLTQIFKANMESCGIDITLEYYPAGEWFSDGPDGPLFGRKFQLGEFAWLTGVAPSCNLYITDEIPGPPEEGYAAGWGGSNESGWSNAEYDAVCKAALGSLPGTPEYVANHEEAQRVWSREVPVIPLFLRLKVAAARPEVKNFGVDPTENSELWNMFEIDLEN